MSQLVIQPLDQIMARYGKALSELSGAKAHKVMARALNYEGRKAFTQVKRALRQQTSIPRTEIERSTRFKQAGVAVGGALEIAIIGKGRELPLKRFQPRQFAAGTKATVWGKRQLYPGTFMGPRPGVLAPKLHGHVFVRTSKSRLPIQRTFGPSVPKEMVKDQSAEAFYASQQKIIDRIEKEIGAAARGF